MADDKRIMTINMGPQHPATHGVLRIELRARRGDRRQGHAFHRLPAPGRRKARRDQDVSSGPHPHGQARLHERPVEQPRLLPGLRESPRPRGAQARPVPEGYPRGAAEDRGPSPVARHARPRHRGNDRFFLYLPGARVHHRHHRERHRRAPYAELHQDRRARQLTCRKNSREWRTPSSKISHAG